MISILLMVIYEFNSLFKIQGITSFSFGTFQEWWSSTLSVIASNVYMFQVENMTLNNMKTHGCSKFER